MAEYPTYNGMHVGIVVQNNDPQYRGRVKVFVPHISPTVYKNWIENTKDKAAKDRVFKFLGDNISSDLTNIVDDLKLVLPWAEVSSPVAGEATMGRYHASSHLATTSDGSNREYLYNSTPTAYTQNTDNISEKPGHIFDMANVNLSDAFNNPQLTNVNNVNKLSYNYTPECYSNSGKGSFAIPNVGAHVWVFFNCGDPLKPVVFGVSHGAADWSSIYDASPGNPGMDYPGEYENAPISSENINAETYRNKYVINQKGGTLAFVNTDNRELLKLTHYSGSFKEFNNQANIELAVNNDQKLVLGDTFDTVRGSRNTFTQRDYDNVIAGDHYRKVGDLNVSLYKQWKSIMDPIADIKQLFDIRRTYGVHESVTSYLKLNSSQQIQSGSFDLCPVCAGGQTNLAINDSFAPGYRAWANVAQAQVQGGNTVGKKNIFGTPQWGVGAVEGAGSGFIGSFITGIIQNFLPSQIAAITSNFPLVGSDGSTLQNAPGSPLGSKCPCCGGTGLSPSSFNGVWAPETKKLIDLPRKMLDAIPELAKVEAQMGLGGSEIIEITKHKIETIGTVMNDWGAIRIDPKGKIEPSYVQIQPGGTLVARTPTPLIEQVQIDDLPGGTYTLNVCNRYNVLVGAGGLNLKSYGVVNLTGALTNIAGEQVNIGSANEVNIDGGKRLSLVGDIVHIKQRNNEQVLLDGDVGISGNLIVKGGVYIEHKLAAHGTDVPQRKRENDPTTVSGGPVSEMCNGVSIPMDVGGKVSNPKTRELKPGGGTFLYMGYTDPGKKVGWVPPDDGNKIGKIKSGTALNISNVSGLKVATGDAGIQDVYVVGTATITLAADVDVYSTGFAVEGTGPSGNGGSPASTNQVETTKPSNVLSLRGLPSSEVQKLVTAAKVPNSGGASLFPVMNVGTGAHVDSIVMAPHTHSFDEGEVGSHMAVRQSFISSGGLALGDETHFGDIKTANPLIELAKGQLT